MIKLLRSKKAEGYIDTVVSTMALMMLLVLALNMFSFLTIKQDMDYFSKEMLTVATQNGKTTGGEIATRCLQLYKELGYYPAYSYEGSDYFINGYSYVQLGDTITITVTNRTSFKGFGIFEIPITLTVTQSGLSQKYWK